MNLDLNIAAKTAAFQPTGIESDPAAAADKTAQAAIRRSLPANNNLSIDTRLPDLAPGEPVAAITDADLSRDDHLGEIVKFAFNLPPPPMPFFS